VSDEKYHDGGYVTGEAPQILPVGDHTDVFPISEFAKELIEKVASAMGVSYDQLAADYQRVEWSASAEFIKIQQQWVEENLKRKYPQMCIDPRVNDESV
jgi:hypothetical protein